MNLHAIVSTQISAINPPITVTIQRSVGYATAADRTRSPTYATPGALTGTIGGTFTATAADDVLTVSAVITGTLQPGDIVSGTDGVNSLADGTGIAVQLTGDPGGAGTYQLTDAPLGGVLNACTVTSVSTVLAVSAVSGGVIQRGQDLLGGGVIIGTTVTGRLNDSAGGAGTYSISIAQTVAQAVMTTSESLTAQVQPLTIRDLRQVEGLNLQGVYKAIYVNGPLDGVVRPMLKGGSITMPNGTVWLVTAPLEQWNETAGWSKAVITLQNDVAVIASGSQSDAQPSGGL